MPNSLKVTNKQIRIFSDNSTRLDPKSSKNIKLDIHFWENFEYLKYTHLLCIHRICSIKGQAY